MKTYETILQNAFESDAIDFARGYDFSEDVISDSPVPSHQRDFIITVDGVDIYYNIAADYYFFAPTEVEIGPQFIEADHNYWCLMESNLGISKYGKKDFRLGLRLSPLENKELGQFKSLKTAKKAYLAIIAINTDEFHLTKTDEL